MADSCFLCAIGSQHVIRNAPASAPEAFGTCHECSVHACPRHGDRTPSYFRCGDCIAASIGGSVLLEPRGGDPPELLTGGAPRLSTLSRDLRDQFDPARLGAAVRWIHVQVRAGESVLPGSERGIDIGGESEAAIALGFSPDDVDAAAAAEAARLRAAVAEALVVDLVRETEVSAAELEPPQLERAGALAAAALAIASHGRDARSPEVSPFLLSGGLLLPPSMVVLGHAYSVASHFFW